jgi:hypothetical protein
MMAIGWPTAGVLRARGLVSPGKQSGSAATAARGRPPADLRGERASTTNPGEFEDCTKKDGRYQTFTVTTRPVGRGMAIPVPQAAEAAAIYQAAAAQCFMSDFAENSPSGRRGPQSEVALIGGITLQFRPISDGADHAPRNLPVSTAYVAGDYKNVSTDNAAAPDFPISPGHSALLIVGRGPNLNDSLYRAIIDLGDFPAAAPTSYDLLSVRVLDPRYLGPSLKLKEGFARFHDPHGTPFSMSMRARLPSAVIGSTSDWFSCDPGCCLSGAPMMAFADYRAAMKKRRAADRRSRSNPVRPPAE